MLIKLFADRKIMTNSSDIDQIVKDILADMPLKEKAAIANLDEDKVPYLQYVNIKNAPKVVVEKKGKTQGAGLARNRDRDSEQFNYQSFLYQRSSAQCGINAFSCLLSKFYADRPKFIEMITIRYVILLNWCQTLPVSQFLSG